MLDPLEKIRDYLQNIPEGNNGEKKGNFMELNVGDHAAGYSIGAINKKEVAVADTIVSKGGIFYPHKHPEIEILTVYEGELHLFEGIENLKNIKKAKAIVLKAGECYRILPGIPHVGVAATKVKFIAITIPASKTFPDAD
jgi:quercetin dioxygenase-like cupin family protein